MGRTTLAARYAARPQKAVLKACGAVCKKQSPALIEKFGWKMTFLLRGYPVDCRTPILVFGSLSTVAGKDLAPERQIQGMAPDKEEQHNANSSLWFNCVHGIRDRSNEEALATSKLQSLIKVDRCTILSSSAWTKTGVAIG